MADIFLGYAKKDRSRASELAEALAALGWSVFWDVNIPAGDTWEDYLEERLNEARCVVVAWSEAAVASGWVKDEAREGRERKILVPVFFEHVTPPFGYRAIQGADLTAWSGFVGAPEFLRLATDIGRFLNVTPKRVNRMVQELTEAIREKEAKRQEEKKRRRSIAARKGWETRRRNEAEAANRSTHG